MPFQDLPDVVRRKAVSVGAHAWLSDLPQLVSDLEREWAIEVGRVYSTGTEAYVAEARSRDGAVPSVLKLMVPRSAGGEHAANEITVLRLANGEGCARLLRSDVARGALLLERLGPPLCDAKLPLARRLQILCGAAAKLWRPVSGCGLQTGAEKGEWLAEFILRTWRELGRPCTERTLEHALACARRRIAGHDSALAVLVHGDVHMWNALQVREGSDEYKLVDPDGLVAEAEYDVSILMREDPDDLLRGDTPALTRTRSHYLAKLTGLDETAIWEWGVVERVSTGLSCAAIDLQPSGREMLEVADRLSASERF